MSSAMNTAATGLMAQDMRMKVISNNLANVNTTGFKKDRAQFETLLYQNVRQVGAQTTQETQLSTGLSVGTGVRVVGTSRVDTQGSVITTDNPLDIAINGQGFFQIQLPDGRTAYTRDGSFKLDSEGRLVNASGYLLEPNITIPQGSTSVTIGSDGIVTIMPPGETEAVQVGQIQTVNFINPTGLQPIGENLLIESPSSGAPLVGTPGLDGLGLLMQGALEGSNVNVVQELVDMIETQRAYEVNSKVISSADEMLRYVNQNL